MKRKIQTITIASAASLLAFAALAQDSSNPQRVQTDYNRQQMAQHQTDRLNGAAKASDLIGMSVNNYQNEKLGKVEDLAVDVESGRIVQVILSTGGVFGIGSTLTVVPPGALHHDVANKVLHLDASKEKLNAAAKFDNAKWEEGTQSNQVIEVYSYYGEHPYFVVGDHDTYGTANTDGTLARTLPRNMDGTINTTGARNMDTAHNKEIAGNAGSVNGVNDTHNTDMTGNTDGTLSRALPRNVDGTIDTTGARTMDTAHNKEIAGNAGSVNGVEDAHNTMTTRNPDGTWTQKYQANRNGANSSGSNLGYVEKGSKLIGTSVRNLQNEKLGKVENFIVDLSSGRIVAVIISSGGYLGMGDELSAVPPTALEFNAERDALQLDTSKETLASAPHFKADQWPDLNQPGYVGGVYRGYHVDPYFTTDANTEVDNTRRNVRDRDSRTLTSSDLDNSQAVVNPDADNTGRNVRDRNSQTLTPLDQSNNKSDVSTTAQIRKGIIADKNMSINAQNVKIITIDGRVTLRGPVNSEAEKRSIGEIANQSAPARNVDNQLEVQTNTDSK